jgi:hypothetical protein
MFFIVEETMKLNHRSTFFIALVVVFVLAACARNSGTEPIVTNPGSVETALASTARALAQQTETAQGYTPTPPITPTVTLTPTPKISLNGTSLVLNEDGSSLFIDHKAGIQLVIPAGWMAMRVNEDEYYKAFTSDVVLANPALSERLTTIQDADLNYFRLDAFDIREGHIPDGIISDINVIFEPGDTRPLEKWARAEASRKRPFKQFKLTSMGYPKTADGTRVLVVEQTWLFDESNMMFYRGVFFSLSTGTLVLDFYTNNAFKDTVLPEFEQLVNSVTLLNP